MKPAVITGASIEDAARKLAGRFYAEATARAKQNGMLYVALSGGRTPLPFFQVLVREYAGVMPWQNIHFFWADERCVPPDHQESNYGLARAGLFAPLGIPSAHLHRIHGESNPGEEVLRYASEIVRYLPLRQGLPVFDIIFLGIGQDGHVASIFPGQEEKLFSSTEIAADSVHPVTGQQRITLTGTVLNHASHIFFFVTGKEKASLIASIFHSSGRNRQYPVQWVDPLHGDCTWFLDEEATSLL